MKKNLLVAQSGGPSAAINATLCGVVEMGLEHPEIEKIYGVKNGIMGMLSERFVNLTELDRKSTRLNSSHRSLSRMPSSA